MLPMLLAAALAASAPDAATVPAPTLAGVPPGAKIVSYSQLKAVDARMYGRGHRAGRIVQHGEKPVRRRGVPPKLRPAFALRDTPGLSR